MEKLLDKRTKSRLKEIKRRSFFSALFKGTTALVIMNSIPLKFLWQGQKTEKQIKVESNPMAVKRNKRG